MSKILVISGPIGSGKSTACKYLKKFGYKYINADRLAKAIIKKNKSVKVKLSKLFDTKNTFEKRIPWKYIRNTIFKNKRIKSDYEKIIHTVFYRELNQIINNRDNFIIEIPLIETVSLIKKDKTIISILSRKANRRARVLSRNTIDGILFNDINNFQKKDSFYAKHSDYVIHNNGMIEKLNKQLKDIIEKNI